MTEALGESRLDHLRALFVERVDGLQVLLEGGWKPSGLAALSPRLTSGDGERPFLRPVGVAANAHL